MNVTWVGQIIPFSKIPNEAGRDKMKVNVCIIQMQILKDRDTQMHSRRNTYITFTFNFFINYHSAKS